MKTGRSIFPPCEKCHCVVFLCVFQGANFHFSLGLAPDIGEEGFVVSCIFCASFDSKCRLDCLVATDAFLSAFLHAGCSGSLYFL